MLSQVPNILFLATVIMDVSKIFDTAHSQKFSHAPKKFTINSIFLNLYEPFIS